MAVKTTKELAMKSFVFGAVVLVVALGFDVVSEAQNYFDPNNQVYDVPAQRFDTQSNMFWPYFGDGPGDTSTGGFTDYLNRLDIIAGRDQQFQPRVDSGFPSTVPPVYQWLWDGYQQRWVLYQVR
jgi:hypothetical protein